MKYFTVNDWSNWNESAATVVAYRSYIQSIRSLLPKDLQLLTGTGGSVSLNDGEIEGLEISIEAKSVIIVINGKWIDGTVVGARIFHLIYEDVVSVTSKIDPAAKGLHGSGYGDHGFDEIEVLGSGIYEHRMLFSSGIELHIRFREFRLDYQDIPNRQVHQPLNCPGTATI